jgi:hypothetical protein
MAVEERDLVGDFKIECPSCSYVLERGGKRRLYDYSLVHASTDATYVNASGSVIDVVTDFVSHDEYLGGASRWKYCILCSSMKPLTEFDAHSARKQSGRQGECRTCKRGYNAVKNQTRLPEQFRESAEQRRLLTFIKPDETLNIGAVMDRFDSRCFKCDQPVEMNLPATAPLKANFDHTRPVFYLWPLTTADATLLCRKHNGDKGQTWPGDFYDDSKCRTLAARTGIPYTDLVGPAHFNPAALDRLRSGEFVDQIFQQFAAYPGAVLKLRNRILRSEGFDFLASSQRLSGIWRDRADAMLG